MRLTTVILLATMLQVSASSFGQKVTFKQKGTTLLKVFKAIEIQTGFSVIYYDKKVNTGSIIDANFNNAPLEEVMNHILSGMPLTYTINKTNVVIKEKEHSLVDKIIDIFTNINVRGKVVDENGQGLAGATIKVKGSTKSVLSNSEGEFFIANVDDKAVLVISYLGYENKEVGAEEKLGTIGLSMSNGKLEEVEINAGYYKVSDRERTGSISRVTAATIAQQPVNNPLMALVGRVPGLNSIQATGIPGGSFNVQIRGRNSINSDTYPLYIIDGVNYPIFVANGSTSSLIGGVSPLSLINPSDIESIEVLKDADATAIYGSRGANGVILITTKKGIKGDTKVDAAFSQGISRVANRVNLMNTQQYLQMRREAFKNDGIDPPANNYDVNGTWSENGYTDWQKELISGNAMMTNASTNISGGTAKSSYLIGGTYYKEGTVYPGNFGLKRMGLHSSINLGSIEDRFHADFVVSYDRLENKLLSQDITELIQLPPNQPAPFDQYGQLNWGNNTVAVNPMAFLLRTNNSETDNLIGNITLSYRIIDNLLFKVSLGYNKINRKELQKTPLASITPLSSTYNSAGRTSIFGNNYINSLSAEPILTYNKRILKGKFEGLIGMSVQSNDSQFSSVIANDFTSDDLMENPGSAVNVKNNNFDVSQYRYIGAFTRLNYSLMDKFFLNLTARRDGSSRFGPGKQYANFGAVGTAWIFSEEKLIKDNFPFLSFGKLRASYGLTGNDQIGNYRYLTLWNTETPYQGSSAITPDSGAPNRDFAWETNKKLEGAIQMGLLENRFNIEVAYYQNRSSNQLLNQSLPLSTGLSSVLRNLPATIQNTGWEIDLKARILSTSKLKWETGFNLTVPKNKLLSYPGLEKSADALKYQIGQPLDLLKTYNITVNKVTGLYTFEDKNSNGVIDNNDRYIPFFLGQRFYGGFLNSFSYKQFSVDIQFSFTRQNGKSYLASADSTPGRSSLGSYSNQLIDIINQTWHTTGDESLIQRYSTTTANNILRSQVRDFGNSTIVDASYIRLRNVNINWSLPTKILSSLEIRNATISFQAQNLFTITNFAGLDPETQRFSLPPLQTLSLGINVTF